MVYRSLEGGEIKMMRATRSSRGPNCSCTQGVKSVSVPQNPFQPKAYSSNVSNICHGVGQKGYLGCKSSPDTISPVHNAGVLSFGNQSLSGSAPHLRVPRKRVRSNRRVSKCVFLAAQRDSLLHLKLLQEWHNSEPVAFRVGHRQTW